MTKAKLQSSKRKNTEKDQTKVKDSTNKASSSSSFNDANSLSTPNKSTKISTAKKKKTANFDMDEELDLEITHRNPKRKELSAASGKQEKMYDTDKDPEDAVEDNPRPKKIQKQIFTSSNNKNSVTKSYRRLDSLARLLEGAGTCSAVCFDGKKILIASNKLQVNSKEENQTKELVIKVMNFFAKLAKAQKIDQNKSSSLFDDIVQQYVPAQQKEFVLKHDQSPNIFLVKLAEYFFNKKEQSHKKAKDLTSHELAIIAGWKNELDAKSASSMVGAAFAIERLAVDFKKVMNAIISRDNANKFQPEIIEAFKKSDNDLILKQSSKQHKNKSKNSGYELLQIGTSKKPLHAEMQIIQRLIDQNKKGDIYIGISKLCCLDCNLAMKSCNEINKNEPDEITFSQESDEINDDKILNLLNRGAHNIDFPKWSRPNFCNSKSDIGKIYDELNKKAERYKEIISEIAAIDKKINKDPKNRATKRKSQTPESLSKEKAALEKELDLLEQELKEVISSNHYVSMHPVPSSSSYTSSPSVYDGAVSEDETNSSKGGDLAIFDQALAVLTEEEDQIFKSRVKRIQTLYSKKYNIKGQQDLTHSLELLLNKYHTEDSDRVNQSLSMLRNLSFAPKTSTTILKDSLDIAHTEEDLYQADVENSADETSDTRPSHRRVSNPSSETRSQKKRHSREID